MQDSHTLRPATENRDSLVDGLYHAASDPSRWQSVMQDLVDQLDSRAARLPVVDPTATDVHSSIEVNIDDRLTRAEIRVAQGLANGLNLEQIAVVNQASIHTVRVQLRSVFAKTGTRQQADLVRVLLSRPALKSA